MEPEQKAPEETAEQERMPLKEISLITESRVKLGPLIAVEMYSPVDGELTRIVYVQSVNIKDSDPDGPPEISLWEVRRMLDLREDAPLFHWEGMDSSRCYFRRNVLGPKISEAPAPLQNYTQDLVTPGGLPTLPLCTTFSGGVKMDRRSVSWLLLVDVTAIGLAFHIQTDPCAPRGLYETTILPLALFLLWLYLVVGCFGHVTEFVGRKAEQYLRKQNCRVIEQVFRGVRFLVIGAVTAFPLWFLSQPGPAESTMSTVSLITGSPSVMNATVSYY